MQQTLNVFYMEISVFLCIYILRIDIVELVSRVMPSVNLYYEHAIANPRFVPIMVLTFKT